MKNKSALTTWWAILIYSVLGGGLLNPLGNWVERTFASINFAFVIISLLVIFIIAILIFEFGKSTRQMHKTIDKILQKVEEVLEKMNKRGQQDKLIAGIVILILAYLIIYFIRNGKLPF